MKLITTVRRAPTNPLLTPYIKYFWSMKAPAHAAIDQWLVPVCNGDLVVSLIHPARCTDTEGMVSYMEGACVCGIRRKCTRIEQKGPIHVVGAAFYPLGLYPFINGSVERTVNRTLPALELMPGFRFALSEESKENEQAAMALLEESLLAVRSQADPRRLLIPEAAAKFCAGEDTGRIKDFCAMNGISPRTFERLIKKHVGVTPREYVSLARVQEAVRGMIDHPTTSLTEHAYEYGFYDQSHFTREFRGKLRRTPSDFRAGGNSVLETIRRE